MPKPLTVLETRARGIARAVKYLPDRLLHPIRRRRLTRQLGRSERVREVVFICHGNICRSPYAAAAFLRRLPPALRPHLRVQSAGFIGPGRPAPAEAIAVGRRLGVELTAHRSQLITPELLANHQLVVVMAPDQVGPITVTSSAPQVIVLGDLDPQPIKRRAITDPFGQAEKVFEESYARIDRCLDTLLSSMYGMAAQSPSDDRAHEDSSRSGREDARR